MEEELVKSNDLMKSLNPRFSLVGSTKESSRIGVGNEIDVTMKFMAWEANSPFQITNDAFHLQKSDMCPKWMDNFFDNNGQFNMEAFILDVCEAVNNSLDSIFIQNKHPRNLSRWQDNRAYARSSCDDCKIQNFFALREFFVQCEFCTVCVSRTKLGICLQFHWSHEGIEEPFYCSIDLVPVYNIKPVDTKRVIRLVNRAMISKSHPQEWYSSLVNFLREDRIVEELWSEGEQVDIVLLKYLGGGRYFIRGGQRLNSEALQKNRRLLNIYTFLKLLRTHLDIENLSNFRMKKILMSPKFLSSNLRNLYLRKSFVSEEFYGRLIEVVLSHDMLKIYFEPYVDLKTMQFKS